MAGTPDPEYVKARRVLLDALECLAPYGGALVLVGAQAIYLQVGAGELAVAPYTTDADLVIRPSGLVTESSSTSSSPRSSPGRAGAERGSGRTGRRPPARSGASKAHSSRAHEWS